MKRELALQLLQSILPDLHDESQAASLFRDLQFLADYKFNKYEMYHPGRLFLESLYLWLQQFAADERLDALEFVRRQLIFVSRDEFQQLAGILYDDHIQRKHFDIAAHLTGIPRHRLKRIRESPELTRTMRSSLYVGMSDGARLDFLRRHNLDISNEQVLPYYAVDGDKISECLQELRTDVQDSVARFRCLFLIDDFCGSGRTLLREVVAAKIALPWTPPVVPTRWQSLLRFKVKPDHVLMESAYSGPLSGTDHAELAALDSDAKFKAAVEEVSRGCSDRNTVLKGSLVRVACGPFREILDAAAGVFFCPLLITEYALERLTELIPRLPPPFAGIKILPAAVLGNSHRIDPSSAVGRLCERYYDASLGDSHTGDVKFGYDGCSLPLVLHHNTPNNSLFLLWARRNPAFTPLFVRHERHGREGT